MSGEPAVIRIKPFYYVHVLDNNSNVTRVEEGPQTFTRQDHEKILAGPEPMILIPPRNYVIIQNPVVRDAKGAVVRSKDNQIKLRHGDSEIRFEQDPFALFPGEKLFGKVTPLQVVAHNTALRIRCIRDFVSADGTKRIAGDEWLFEGPGTYLPSVETQVVEVVRAVIIRPNQALKIRARKDTIDRFGKKRGTSEEWIVRTFGSYLPGVDEEIVETLNAHILTDKKAIHLRAAQTFKDAYGKVRKAGEEWLVTLQDTEAHILDVFEQFVAEVKLTTVSKREYCVVLDPWKEGKQLLGVKDLRKGEDSFFLQPGEKLERGIQPVIVLSEEEALLLRAIQTFVDSEDQLHNAGDRWMINGPTDFVPPVEVEVLEKRKVIALDENEGVYVRDIKTGRVRVVSGQSYLLKPNEELWSKELPRIVEELLYKDKDHAEERDKTKLVTFKTPHNSAVQIYDYKQKKSRVLFGPDLVLLQPDEEFTVVQLSGGHPKKPNQIKSLCLLLGPDFMTDLVIVETADHARLSLKLSYNWYFDVDRTKEEEATKLFAVGDFVGETCKAIASRVRGTVASVTFDQFHRNSAKVIQTALFGDALADNLRFNTNNLVMTNVDIQSVEPVDQRTRDSLQKSVQLAIEITTSSQEAAARHESERTEQEAVGRLERQKISDEAAAERARTALVQLQAECAAIESTGQATAEAKARAEAAKIEGEAAVKQAELSAQAARIKSESDLTNLKNKQQDEIEHQKAVNKLEIERSQLLSDIEAEKFAGLVEAIGAETIEAMANAGPEMQAKLLKSLGLTSFLITDGNSPINLFNTAQGLVATQPR